MPSVAETRRRLALVFPEGLTGRGALVRDLAARTVVAALFVGAVGDPDADEARLMRPSMVVWMSDEALLAGRDDDRFRGEWHRAARSSRRSVAAVLARRAAAHVPWYAENTREPIRDEILRVWRERYGAVRGRAGLAPTSPAASMTLAADFAALFDPALDGGALAAAVEAWQGEHLPPPEQLRLRAQRSLDRTTGRVPVSLPGRGDRMLPPGRSSALTRASIEGLLPRLLRQPYVLAVCHAGDPTADADRVELERAGLSLADSPALPDVIVFDAADRGLWLLEIVVSGGEITEHRRRVLRDWAGAHGFADERCRYVTVYRSRADPLFRRTVATLAWGSVVWLADEPEHIVRLDRLDPPAPLA